LQELMAFPSSKYDDQVDSTSQYLKWVEERRTRYRSTGARPVIYTYDTETEEGYWAGGNKFSD